MSVFRVVFLGTPDFAVTALETLLKDEHFEIAGVVTQPDRPAGRKMQLKASPVKELAQEHDLPLFCPEKINTVETLSQIKSLRADVAVVVAYGEILSADFLKIFPLGAVNLHGSILPRWRGAAPIQRAIMAGDAKTGVTLQKVTEKLDAGDVLGIRELVLQDQMDAEFVYDYLKNISAELLCLEFLDYLRGNLAGQKQDESQVTVAKKIRKEEGKINWTQPARQILNQWRALKMWPGVWTLRSGKILKIHQMKIVEESSQGAAHAGLVLQVSPTSVVVGCGTGSIEIFELQPESRAKMLFADYQKGYAVAVDEKWN